MNVSMDLVYVCYSILLVFLLMYIYRLYRWLFTNDTFADGVINRVNPKKNSTSSVLFKEPVDKFLLTVIYHMSHDFEVTYEQISCLKILLADILKEDQKFEVICLEDKYQESTSQQQFQKLTEIISDIRVYNLTGICEDSYLKEFITCSLFARGKYICESYSIADEIDKIIEQNTKKNADYLSLVAPKANPVPPFYKSIYFALPVAISKSVAMKLFLNLHNVNVGYGYEILLLCQFLKIEPKIIAEYYSKTYFDVLTVIGSNIWSGLIPFFYRKNIYQLNNNNNTNNNISNVKKNIEVKKRE